MKKIIGMIFNMMIALLILASSLYLVSTFETLKNPIHLPSVLGFTPLTVISSSMSPGIETGDLVVIRNGSDKIKPGDVITYRLNDVLVTHRVKSISAEVAREVFVTQGDANTVPDYETVEQSQIVGKYAFKIPFGGYLMASLRGLPGMLIILGLGLIAIMSEVLRLTIKKVKEVEESLLE